MIALKLNRTLGTEKKLSLLTLGDYLYDPPESKIQATFLSDISYGPIEIQDTE
jgi:hypothetical protein